jgi:mRNA-degrading endonuclease toxin of MazEF toxin-antitoxin module
MKINQLDIVEVYFDFGGNIGSTKHPVIVISQDEILQEESLFYGVLMSTKNHYPEWTLAIDPDMINNPVNQRESFVVCHQIQQFYPSMVAKKQGSLKKEFFPLLKKSIINSIFG